MNLSPVVEWSVFGVFGFIAIAGALGMATTMSMFRSGVFLMASFIGVAGLFILLSADLLSLLQIMMYIGGMLVMILFMVLFSHDPGGAMMAGMMELPPLEKFFSLGLAGSNHHGDGAEKTQRKAPDEEPAERQDEEKNAARSDGGDDDGEEPHAHGGEKQGEHHNGMDMSEMSMTTPLKPYAALLGSTIGVLLVALLLLRPAWPVVEAIPNPNSARQVGSLLMGKYMIAFEGAGLLILLGIVGAVFISRPGKFSGSGDRGQRVAADAPPAPADGDEIVVGRDGEAGDVDVTGAHQDVAQKERS